MKKPLRESPGSPAKVGDKHFIHSKPVFKCLLSRIVPGARATAGNKSVSIPVDRDVTRMCGFSRLVEIYPGAGPPREEGIWRAPDKDKMELHVK